MKGNIGEYLISNNEPISSKAFVDIIPSDISAKKIYEVIRIINKKALFLNDHYERLISSFLAIEQNIIMTRYDLDNAIKKLISVNDEQDFNAMLEIFGDDKQEWVLYIRESSYPTESMYQSGVYMTTLKLTRNLPEAKIWDADYKKKIEEQIDSDKCYEVILVNEEGYMTEGSRSNIFFVKDDRIYTAPKEYVLRGITSIYAVEACEDIGCEVISKLISVKDIRNFDAAFMTGTSVNILPISQIDDVKLDSANNIVVKKVMNEFDKYII